MALLQVVDWDMENLPPAHVKVTHLMSAWPNMQEARERFKTTRSLCVMWGLLAMFRNRKWLFEIFQSQFGNPQISPFEFLSCTACWSKKQGAGMLTSHAKRIFCDNITCFGTTKCCSNRSHLPECCIKAPHFLLAWLLCFFASQPTRLPSL